MAGDGAPGAALGGRVLVVGFARTGTAVARVLVERGASVVAVDDAPSPAGLAEAARLGVPLTTVPGGGALADLLAAADLVVASPGVPPDHPVLAAARPGQVVSEIELASRLGGPPVVAITGTNGKTTVTSLVAAMLGASGRKVRAAGNIGYPLVEAVAEPGLDLVVAEVSSFQLALATTFHPAVATWLNFAEDHLDWHADLDDYAAAKARIFACQGPEDVAVVNVEDPAVMDRAATARARLVTFGLGRGDFHLEGDLLVGPGGTRFAAAGDLRRALPHDLANALAACATAAAAGAAPEACATAIRSEAPLAHRVELVGSAGGVSWYDDSKATTPSAVVAALAGFDSVVLLAGGRNKGLDLGAIARAADAAQERRADGRSPLRAVVAIGESAPAVVAAFRGRPTVVASSMAEAVELAAGLAEPGDAVLLSPGCASFDWYASYEERGADFARIVRRRLAAPEGAR